MKFRAKQQKSNQGIPQAKRTKSLAFSDFKFHESLNEGLSAMGFNEPTPIQEKAIPIIQDGEDLIACAQTGTGKTAAYVLPVLDNIAKRNTTPEVKVLIIAPTRELAIQIDQQIEGFSYFTHASSIAIYGGTDGQTWDTQKKAIMEGVDILVATPGRLIALLNSHKVNLAKLECLILDEADRMLDMGFSEDIDRIISHVPKERQTLLFSATMPPKIRQLASKRMKDPKEVAIAISKPAEGIFQKAFLTHDNQKTPLLRYILGSGVYDKVIVFASTRQKVKDLEKEIRKLDLVIEAFHSDLTQDERKALMNKFKAERVNVLVGTDILSRGIDVENIELIINYDVPPDPEDYVHRIGRTARAKSTGEAVTFINSKDFRRFADIERLIDREILKTNKLPSDIGTGPEWRTGQKSSGKRFNPKRRR